jgi:excinuclease UvrABC nuclease subunit
MPDFNFPNRVQLYLPEQPVTDVPNRPGIYILFDEKRRVRRMVTTKDLRARARYYLHEREEADEMSVARRESVAMGWLETFSRFETRYAHMVLFRAYFPDAFQTLYRLPSPHLLRVTMGEAYPRIFPTRSAREREHVHIGPYLHREMAENDAAFVNDLLNLRRCDYEIIRFQPYERCLYLQMRTCVAPCDTFPQPDYCALAEQALSVLGGEVQAVVATLAARRDAAAEALEFEKAMRWRDEARKVEQWAAARPAFLRPLHELNLVVPQRTEFGLDLFVVREGALVDWLRLSEPDEQKVTLVLAEAFGGSFEPPDWRDMRDEFAFISRWLWDREYNAHVLVDDPAQAAAEVMAWAQRTAADIADEGREEDLPVEEAASEEDVVAELDDGEAT